MQRINRIIIRNNFAQLEEPYFYTHGRDSMHTTEFAHYLFCVDNLVSNVEDAVVISSSSHNATAIVSQSGHTHARLQTEKKTSI